MVILTINQSIVGWSDATHSTRLNLAFSGISSGNIPLHVKLARKDRAIMLRYR